MEWVEWQYIPTWIMVGWLCCIGLNVYHWFSLQSYVNQGKQAAAETDDSLELDDMLALKKETKIDDLFEGFNLNKIE